MKLKYLSQAEFLELSQRVYYIVKQSEKRQIDFFKIDVNSHMGYVASKSFISNITKAKDNINILYSILKEQEKNK